MYNYFKKLKPHHQTLFAIIIAFAVIAFWRGIWGLLDEYLFPNYRELSLWISLFVGLLILILTHYASKELK
ncbi:MAG: hypothetical protein ABIG93_02060 [archaeon]|nr:hypothetical protein [Nanoarchaeota archaeon]